MQTLTYKLTVDDLDDFPDDGMRYELINGELCMSPSPIPSHQELVGRLHLLIGPHVRDRRLGRVFVAPLDVRFSGASQVVPDLVFVSAGRLDIIGGKRLEGPPELVIEVLSPSTQGNDLFKKRDLYERYGVPEYWLVDPKRSTLTMLAVRGGRYVELPTSDHPRSTVLPDLKIDLPALFADLD